MTQDYQWRFFNGNGEEVDESNNPVVWCLIGKHFEYEQGYYFCDEVQLLTGPFSSFEECLSAYKDYTP